MMKMIAVGKIKEKVMRLQIEEFEKRLRPYVKLEVVEVNDEIAPQSNSDAQNEMVKDKEAQRVMTKIKDGEYVILLDLWGEMLNSPSFAKKIETLQTYGKTDITFVIAGSLGPGQAILKRADYRWKLSDLTFTHQMTRVLVLEQIYRCFMILHHKPYHK